jgi:hypothetical protein
VTYAKRTIVPADKTRLEIERTLTRYGAKRFAYFTEAERSIIVFEASDRRIRFDLPMRKDMTDQALRSRWRGLLLCVKAKLESVEAGIETFEEAFLAHVVLPDGLTVGQHTKPAIADAYAGKDMPALLPAPSRINRDAPQS